MLSTNARSFSLDLRRFAEKVVPEEQVKLHRFITLDLLRRVVLKSPVRSGRFQGAWSVSLQLPDPRPVSASGAPALGPEKVISNAISELEALRPFSVAWVHNPMVYGPRLENGYSGQAPNGVVATSVAEIQAGLSQGPTT